MKLPYILVADADSNRRDSFVTVFEKQVAYAAVCVVHDGQSFLSFLSSCTWKGLPELIILSHELPDMAVPDVIRELLPDPRYQDIPKLVMTPATEKREIEECRMLGIKHFLTIPGNQFELETNVRIIDNLLKSELDLL